MAMNGRLHEAESTPFTNISIISRSSLSLCIRDKKNSTQTGRGFLLIKYTLCILLAAYSCCEMGNSFASKPMATYHVKLHRIFLQKPLILNGIGSIWKDYMQPLSRSALIPNTETVTQQITA